MQFEMFCLLTVCLVNVLEIILKEKTKNHCSHPLHWYFQMINLTKNILVVINSNVPYIGRTPFLIHDIAVRVLISVLDRPRQ